MIVITRPQQVSLQLVTALQKKNIDAIALPLIEIEGVALSSERQKHLNLTYQEESVSLINHIFVSPNAVKFSAPYLQAYHRDNQEQNHCHEVYAIGKQTAEQLRTLGYQKIHIASPPYNSEALLSLNNLQTPQAVIQQEKSVSSKINHVFIWCIMAGRKLLEETLVSRGFSVHCLPVYQQKNRGLSEKDKQKIQLYRQANHKPLMITATSQSIVQQLVSTPVLKNDNDHLICFSQRIANYAQQQGWKNLHVTQHSDTSSLVNKLIEVNQNLKLS